MESDYGLILATGSPNYEKTPDETIRVPFHWAERLDGETISTTTYELPDGLTNAAEIVSGSVREIRVSGSSVGTFRVICKVTTSGSRTLEWVKRVVVREA